MAYSLEELNLKLARLEGAEECRNLMGKYSYLHTAFRNNEFVDLWAKREDDLLWMPWGKYHGYAGVCRCYQNEHGDRSDPHTLEMMKGGLMMHEMDTEYLVVAEDGQSARGCWISPGHESVVDRGHPDHPEDHGTGLPHGEWAWSLYQVDFIKEDGVWKFWKMRLFPLFKCTFGESWVTTEQPKAEDYTLSHPDDLGEMWSYTPETIYPSAMPHLPAPYASVEDMEHYI